MNYKSLQAGLKKFYDGKENQYLAQLLLYYFSRGKQNSEVSYHQYLTEFIIQLMSDANRVAFDLLDENRDN